MKGVIYSSVLLLAFAISFCGCSKPECEKYNTGDVKFINYKGYSVYVWLDGNYEGQIPGGVEEIYYDLSAGVHAYNVEQVSGYFLFPAKWAGDVDIIQCKEKTLTIQ